MSGRLNELLKTFRIIHSCAGDEEIIRLIKITTDNNGLLICADKEELTHILQITKRSQLLRHHILQITKRSQLLRHIEVLATLSRYPERLRGIRHPIFFTPKAMLKLEQLWLDETIEGIIT